MPSESGGRTLSVGGHLRFKIPCNCLYVKALDKRPGTPWNPLFEAYITWEISLLVGLTGNKGRLTREIPSGDIFSIYPTKTGHQMLGPTLGDTYWVNPHVSQFWAEHEVDKFCCAPQYLISYDEIG